MNREATGGRNTAETMERGGVPLLRVIVGCLAPGALLLAAGLALFPSAGRDDAYISYWPAHSLARSGEILNYNGARVEQSSSLLHVLLLGLVERLTGAEPTALGRAFSVLAALLCLPLVYRLASLVHPRAGPYAAFLTATYAYFAYWSFGGLESTLVALVALCLVLAAGSFLGSPGDGRGFLVLAALASGAFTLSRPEMPIVMFLTFAAAAFAAGSRGALDRSGDAAGDRRLAARALRLLAVTSGVSLLAFAARWLTFGHLFPQPVRAKSAGFAWDSALRGSDYLREHLLANPYAVAGTAMVALAVAWCVWTFVRQAPLDAHILISVAFLATYTSFVMMAGGDWMEGGRFVVHMAPVGLALVPGALFHMRRAGALAVVILLLLVAAQVKGLVSFATYSSTSVPFWAKANLPDARIDPEISWGERHNRVSVRDIPTLHYMNQLVERLLEHREGPVWILSGQMGMIPFHVSLRHEGKVRLLDRRGLVDGAFTDCAVTSGLPRTWAGLGLSYSFYFENRDRIEQSCAVPRPDIIFDDSLKSADDVSRHGYEIVYSQSGRIHGDDGRFAGSRVLADQFIAVRDDLRATLGSLEPARVEFPP